MIINNAVLAALMMYPAQDYLIYCIDNEKYGPFNSLRVMRDISYQIFPDADDPVSKMACLIITILMALSVTVPYAWSFLFALGISSYIARDTTEN